jgi:hypothetical protein
MEVIRKIMYAQQLSPIMHIPPQMQNRQVEVTISLLLETKEPARTVNSMKGYLKQYANPALITQEKNAWTANLKEKYGNF